MVPRWQVSAVAGTACLFAHSGQEASPPTTVLQAGKWTSSPPSWALPLWTPYVAEECVRTHETQGHSPPMEAHVRLRAW